MVASHWAGVRDVAFWKNWQAGGGPSVRRGRPPIAPLMLPAEAHAAALAQQRAASPHVASAASLPRGWEADP
eukprot:tig00020560_g11093.t1